MTMMIGLMTMMRTTTVSGNLLLGWRCYHLKFYVNKKRVYRAFYFLARYFC